MFERRYLLLYLLILFFSEVKAQDIANKNWRIGLCIPIVNVDLYQREMWTGLSLACKGFTVNYYGRFVSEFFIEGSGEFKVREPQPWVYETRMSFGYSYMFGKSATSNFNPMLGLYLLTMQGAEPDFDVGFRYKNLVFLVSPHFESQSNAKWFPTFGKATSRNMVLKFKLQYLL